MSLEKLLGEIWGRSHHIFPKRVIATILQWIIESDDVTFSEVEYSLTESNHPAVWAPDVISKPDDYNYWGEGLWS